MAERHNPLRRHGGRRWLPNATYRYGENILRFGEQ
jgi:hypothetical protein